MAKKQNGEEGYLLIAVLFIMALLIFALATAAPRVSYDLRRDREIETVHRGKQYARAIQLYYRKFGHYPVSIDELLDSNHMRFLRRKYADPMTGKPDWRLIHLGDAKTLSTGGPPGRVGIPAGQAGLSGGAGGDPNSLFGGGGQRGQTTGSPGLVGQTPSGIVSTITPTDGGKQPGTGAPGDSSGLGSNGLSSGPGSPSSNQPGDATPGSNVGGGPILGVSSINPRLAIKIISKMQHYNEWEFIYDPSLDLGGLGGANGTQGVAPVGGQQNPFQSSGGQGQPDPTAPPPQPSPPPNPNQ